MIYRLAGVRKHLYEENRRLVIQDEHNHKLYTDLQSELKRARWLVEIRDGALNALEKELSECKNIISKRRCQLERFSGSTYDH